MDKVIFFLAFIIFLPIIWFFGKDVPYQDLSDIFDSLKDTAAIIFAILGAWIAVIYPKDLKAIFHVNNSKDIEATVVFEKLISSLIIVTFTLIVMIASMPIMALIKNIPFFQGYKEYLRQALLLYIYLLTLAQVYALLATLIPNIKMFSVHDKFHRTLILSGFCLLKIAKISLNSSFFPKPIKR